MSPAPSRSRPRWLQFLLTRKRRVALFTMASVSAGLLEAIVLALIAHLAVVISKRTPLSAPWPLSAVGQLSVGQLVLLGLACTVARGLMAVTTAAIPARLISEAQAQLRTDVYRAFSEADWRTQSSVREGSLQQAATGQVDQSASALLFAMTALSAAITLVVLVASALVIHPIAALAILSSLIILYLAFRPISALVQASARATADANLEFATSLSESAQMSTELTTFGTTAEAQRRLNQLIAAGENPLRRTTFFHGLVSGLYQSAALMLALGSLAIAQTVGTAAIATMGAVVLILLRALAYSQQLQAIIQRLHDTRAHDDLLAANLENLESNRRGRSSERLIRFDSLELKRVTFSYGRGVYALRDVSLHVGRGDAIAIAGPSGAGKSSVLHLLCRLLRPQDGQYLVNGRPAECYREDDWAAVVAYLPQEGRLLQATVAENIGFLRPEFTDVAIRAAAVAANIHDDIMSWDEQYDTPIGQRAHALSGGQRQRLCLARALLGEPDVLILDEPTSALDARSEELIVESLSRLKGDVTMLIVTHKPTLTRLCDRVVPLRNGRIDEITPDRRSAVPSVGSSPVRES
jgi:ATP-binding cassette subfamily B protein